MLATTKATSEDQDGRSHHVLVYQNDKMEGVEPY
jgi:hypothetical protein